MRVLGITAVLCLLAAAVSADPVRVRQPKADDEELAWWQTSVIYQIYPRSFKDSNGDGVGDLRGIINQLEYLQQLGVGAVWLSPIYQSPMVDLGYDISNYFEIDPVFGTMDDFNEFRDKAHSLGLQVMMDYVVSYTSDQIEWFQKSLRREDGYDEWYVWAVGERNESAPHGYNVPSNWLSLFRGSAWEWSEERQHFYLHSFTINQPDLNYRDDGVVLQMKDVLRFWLDKKVDGFRVDAVSQMYEAEGFPDELPSGLTNDTEANNYLQHVQTQNRPETYEMIKQWRAILDEYQAADGKAKAMMLEVYDDPEIVMPYYGTPEEPGAQFPFNFYFISQLNAQSNASDVNRAVHLWMDNMPEGNWPNWVLGNHDQPRVGTRLGVARKDLFNMISLLLPGTAITFMGEEIGMENTHVSWEDTVDPWALNAGPDLYESVTRDPERTPFQWNTSANAGFTDEGVKPWLPVNENYLQGINVESELEADLSHIKVYRKLVDARGWRVAQRGALDTAIISEWVFAFTRTLDGEPTVVVVGNLGTDVETVDLSATFDGLPDQLTVHAASISSSTQSGATVSPQSVTLEAGVGLVLVANSTSAA
ncbi:maltase 2-like [Schistocerca piceifrons]|uniref:maltase 2-like n=1 Tax=Schistocerca piceifrons TaxID=274613 RepID=UPI001F5E6AD2|nr:maltase 2-like [Schistocerca piceifrons]